MCLPTFTSLYITAKDIENFYGNITYQYDHWKYVDLTMGWVPSNLEIHDSLKSKTKPAKHLKSSALSSGCCGNTTDVRQFETDELKHGNANGEYVELA